MNDQLTATLFGLVIVGTAILAGSTPAPHAPAASANGPSHRVEHSARIERDAWQHKRSTYGDA